MALNLRIKNRRDTDANWKSRNPVLLDGELAIVASGDGNPRLKIGDGVSTYSQLPYKIFDSVAYPVSENVTLSVDNIKNIVLSMGKHTITVPSIYENAQFIIKNISTELTTVKPANGVTIDGSSDSFTLKKNEFVHILQYSETGGYAIIADNRTIEYNLMNLNLEDTITISNKTVNG